MQQSSEEQFLEVSVNVLPKLKIAHVIGKAVWDQGGVLGAGSIAVVHASIIGDFGIGYQAGKNQAYSDWNGGYSQNDSCPSGNSISYCSGYRVGYDGTLQQAQP
jgi:hypothetical protein